MTAMEPAGLTLPPLQGLVDQDFAVLLERVVANERELYPCEHEQIASAADKRRLEYAAGRKAARQVLGQLGVPPCAIPRNPDGSPQWPPGIRGSISHAGPYCFVAATKAKDVRGIGVDLELDPAAALDVEALICTTTERAFIRNLDESLRPLAPALFFSAKESFYKCQRPITGVFLDFLDVEIELDLARQSFRLARVPGSSDQRKLLMNSAGRFQISPSAVATSAVIRV